MDRFDYCGEHGDMCKVEDGYYITHDDHRKCINDLKAELKKREDYWCAWNGRAANHAAKLEAFILKIVEAEEPWSFLVALPTLEEAKEILKNDPS